MLRSLQRELRHRGFDLCHPIHTNWYNTMIRDEGLLNSGTLKELPETPAIKDGDTFYNAVLIGNTKRVWPMFLNWLASQGDNLLSPFDTFVEENLSNALEECLRSNLGLISYELFWSNGRRDEIRREFDSGKNTSTICDKSKDNHCYDYAPTSFLVSMQRIAVTTGEYWHDDSATKLCVHPVYGTWTAFRVVVVFETNNNTHIDVPTRPNPCPCPVSERELKKAKTIFDNALKLSSSDENGYGATLDKSWVDLCKYLHNTQCGGSEWDQVPNSMKPWIQLRDVISIGREAWKYDDAQLLYHYTKDPDILVRELITLKNA